MGGRTGSRESASKRLWPLGDLHRWRARMYWLPLLGRRVRRSHPFFLTSRVSPAKTASEVVCWFVRLITISCRIKALLFTLVRGFEFELALPAEDIVRTTAIVGRPTIASNPAAGPQLPLLIRPANMD